MPEYIDREAVQEILKKYSVGTRREILFYPNEIIRASIDVDAIPAANVDPVVRCKDCKWKTSWYKNDYGNDICGVSGLYHPSRNRLLLLRRTEGR